MASRALAGEPYVMPPITVEASALDASLPAQTEITREEIIDSHKNELTDVLTLTPGLSVRQGGQGEARADLRGFDQRATLFTLNGVPLYEPYNGIVNLDLVPLEMLESVNVARGPSSSLFGPNGMSGTVKMTTLKARAPLQANLSTTWRKADFWNVRASAGLARERVSAVIGGRFLTAGDFPLSGSFSGYPPGRARFDHDGRRFNSDRREHSIFADFSYAFAGGGGAHATLLSSSAQFGIPPNTIQFIPSFQRVEREEFNHIQISADHSLTSAVGVSGAVFFSSYDRRNQQFTGPDLRDPFLTSMADSEELGGMGRVTTAVSARDSLSLAVQVRRAQADLSDSASGPLGQPDFTTASAAFENEYFLGQRVRLFVGLSFDVQTGGHLTSWEIDPQGGVSADFGRFGMARAGVSRKIRFPTLRELFDPLQGNLDLQPEKALAYEVGHRVAGKSFYIDASLFRNEVSDLIENGRVGTVQRAVNLEDAVLQGFEAAVGGAAMRFLRLDLNYTFLDAKARKNLPLGEGSFTEVQHRPSHRFNGTVNVLLPQAFALRLEGIYSSDQVDTFGTDVRAPEYGVFNLQLRKRLGTHLEVFAGVDNVLDASYEQKLGAPLPGRWEYAGLLARY